MPEVSIINNRTMLRRLRQFSLITASAYILYVGSPLVGDAYKAFAENNIKKSAYDSVQDAVDYKDYVKARERLKTYANLISDKDTSDMRVLESAVESVYPDNVLKEALKKGDSESRMDLLRVVRAQYTQLNKDVKYIDRIYVETMLYDLSWRIGNNKIQKNYYNTYIENRLEAIAADELYKYAAADTSSNRIRIDAYVLNHVTDKIPENCDIMYTGTFQKLFSSILDVTYRLFRDQYNTQKEKLIDGYADFVFSKINKSSVFVKHKIEYLAMLKQIETNYNYKNKRMDTDKILLDQASRFRSDD